MDVASIDSLEGLTTLPVTTKEHLQQQNMEFLCVERKKIIDYITTSGTTGSPITFGATEMDLQRLADNEHASFLCADGSDQDIYQLMLTLDRRFMAGIAYFLGLRKLGAGIIRVGPGNAVLQFDTIQRTSPTVLVTVPSFLLKLIDYAKAHHIERISAYRDAYREMGTKGNVQYQGGIKVNSRLNQWEIKERSKTSSSYQ